METRTRASLDVVWGAGLRGRRVHGVQGIRRGCSRARAGGRWPTARRTHRGRTSPTRRGSSGLPRPCRPRVPLQATPRAAVHRRALQRSRSRGRGLSAPQPGGKPRRDAAPTPRACLWPPPSAPPALIPTPRVWASPPFMPCEAVRCNVMSEIEQRRLRAGIRCSTDDRPVRHGRWAARPVAHVG